MAHSAFNSEELQKIDMCSFSTGTAHMVKVTHINHPGSFFVRPVSRTSHVKLLEVKGKLISPQEINIRKRVIYNSKTLDEFVRGEIESVDNDNEIMTCSINAIDYGCLDTNVYLENIFLPGTTASINCPPMAIHCELYFCHPLDDTFDDNAIETMKFFVGSHPARMTVHAKTKDKLMVDLRTVECPDNLSTMLAYMNCSKLVAQSYSVNRFDCPNVAVVLRYKPKPVKVGDKLFVRVQSAISISDFYVTEYKDYKNYVHEAGTISEYFRREPQQDIELAARDGLCCIIRTVECPNKYERGIVKEVKKENNKCLVKLIDWGKEVEVNFNDVKKASSEYYTVKPAMAIHCSSTPDQTWKNGLPKFLYPGYQFIIEITELGNDEVPHKVNLIKSEQIY